MQDGNHGLTLDPTDIDAQYMRRCLQLAAAGRETSQPNPMVGAVVVKDGRIIGEGWHRRVGLPHAEPMAIRAVRNQDDLRFSTLYVNLEPCSHYGKTPPCVDLILEKRIPRVVIGTPDLFPLVAGRGIEKLRAANVEVVVGVEAEACRELNRHFFTFHALKRPYVTLKWAMTADGFIDYRRTFGDGQTQLHISTPFTRLITHKMRAEHAVILVGRKTALLDNPHLTVRDWSGPHPIRAVVDRHLTLPQTLHLFDGHVKTLVFTEKQRADQAGVSYITLDFSLPIVEQIMQALYERNLQTLLVEGGSTLLQSFLDKACWDEMHLETSDQLIGEGVPAPSIDSVQKKQASEYLHREAGTVRVETTFHALRPLVYPMP